MRKRVGNIEVNNSLHGSVAWVTVTYHCNASVSEAIVLRDYDDIVDALYALNRVKAEIDEHRARQAG